mgnify:CR=1 FL=1
MDHPPNTHRRRGSGRCHFTNRHSTAAHTGSWWCDTLITAMSSVSTDRERRRS